MDALTIAFRVDDGAFAVEASGPALGEGRGAFAIPYDQATWSAVFRALTPGYRPDPATERLLQPLGSRPELLKTVGSALAGALLASAQVRDLFDRAMAMGMKQRTPVPVELRFGEGCDPVAMLPWELIYHHDHFLVAGTTVALSRYPEAAIPPTPGQADLPLRMLLILSEPLDAGSILPRQARYELLHGLRHLDEQGAIIVDVLRPPTFQMLTEALTAGEYQVLVFYGHGIYHEGQGHLLFEDEFGGGALIGAQELGIAVRNSDVRLVLLGACESAAIGQDLAGAAPVSAPDIWSATSTALVRAGVPMVIGMQVSMRVDAALAFFRQFALSVAAGKPVIAAVADARKPLAEKRYDSAWFIPALYGRPDDAYRLFDPNQELPAETADVRSLMKAERREIGRLEQEVGRLGTLEDPGEIARLRAAKRRFAEAHAELARRTPGGYAAVTSLLYGVPANPAFAGRHKELVEVGQALKGEHPVVIWGAGGIGKTALAIELAQRQGWRYPAGVLWVDCRGGPAFETMLDRIAAFCGITRPDQIQPQAKEATVRAALANLEEPCLLVWDNAEDVWDKRDVRQFIRNRPPNCQMLLTTRYNPEQPMWQVVEVEPLSEGAMTQLFDQLARAAGIKVTRRADAEAIPSLVGWLQGHPLALSLVVPLVAKRGVQRTWRDLQKQPLKGIDAAFTISFERLAVDQQRLFARMSVFTIPWDWEAAEALLPGVEGVDDSLDVLVQRSLVQFDQVRYAYHALVRQFAYVRLQESDDVQAVHRLAAEYLHSKITAPGDGATPDEIREEVDQWEKAGHVERFVERASSLGSQVHRLGFAEVRTRLDRARARLHEELDDRVELHEDLLNSLAFAAEFVSRHDEAIQWWEKLLELRKEGTDPLRRARVLFSLGQAHRRKGESGEATALLRESLATFEGESDRGGIAQVEYALADLYRGIGEWDEAAEHLSRALQTYRDMKDRAGEANTLNGMAALSRDRGKPEEAIQLHQQALEIYRQLDNAQGLAMTQHVMGATYRTAGLADEALASWQEAQTQWQRLGHVQGEAAECLNLGALYGQQGQWGQAAETWSRALELYEQVGDLWGISSTTGNLALVFEQQGRHDEAFDALTRAFQAKRSIGDVEGLGPAAFNLGRAYERRGEIQQALAVHQVAFEHFQRLGSKESKGQLALVSEHMGHGLVQLGNWSAAIAFYEHAISLAQEVDPSRDMATVWSNLGAAHYMLGREHAGKGDIEEARASLANACKIMSMVESPNLQQATQAFLSLFGSVTEAQAYLQRQEEDLS
jgi:tetratricopeptide (TPR) repeat protein